MRMTLQKMINELRKHVQFNLYTVHDVFALQLFEKDVCPNDLDASCIWEDSGKDLVGLFEEAVGWCEDRFEKKE